MKLKWESPHGDINSCDQALNRLKNGEDQFVMCTRDQGSRKECTIEATKKDDDQYLVELSFKNGSVYSHPGFVSDEKILELITSFCKGDDFDFARLEWQKLQNSKWMNALFVAVIIVLGCLAFYYIHTHH